MDSLSRGFFVFLLILVVLVGSLLSASTKSRDKISRPKRSSAYSPLAYPEHAQFLSDWRYIVHLVRTGKLNINAEVPPMLLDPAIYNDDVVAEFNCVPVAPSNPVPTSVHQLRPSDIKVIGAMGDSITAANGVRTTRVIEVFIITNRGESWSIGGDKSLEHRVMTLPNILRKFNPDLIGASTCRPISANRELSALNVAIPGGTNVGIKGQAENLMMKMLEDPSIDYYNDWKMVTLFIGGNDLCRQCRDPILFGPDAYYEGIKAGLDELYTHLPRAIVNVQPMFDISIVRDLNHTGQRGEEICAALHMFECPCGVNQSAADLKKVKDQFFDKLVQLTSGRYDLRKDFTVVLQPHLKDFAPKKDVNGKYDMSFVAPDCFHPSHKAHQLFAYALWNSMFVPVGKKTYNYPTNETLVLHCPKEDEYIYTNCNSGSAPAYCNYGANDDVAAAAGVKRLTASVSTILLATTGILGIRWLNSRFVA